MATQSQDKLWVCFMKDSKALSAVASERIEPGVKDGSKRGPYMRVFAVDKEAAIAKAEKFASQ